MRTAKNMSCSKIIRRRRREAETRNGYIQLLARIILVIVCGGLLFTQGFLLMRAPDNGMFPAIKGGDLLIGFRLQRNFLKNDVVVYKANGKLQVGRIQIGRASVPAQDFRIKSNMICMLSILITI